MDWSFYVAAAAIVMSLASIRISMMSAAVNRATTWRDRNGWDTKPLPPFVVKADYWRSNFWAGFFNRKPPVSS